ncbi:S1C family serine protease [Anaerorhabdus furcosa]|uniref:Serine protease Do n=1 Tax=Anaerorhabdus furcosa TaxID=118967 RepID=A0A1T4K5J7_9FIRM|nr:trypsin-like peptidase domain-containing protein [Anaerorhabdus furcosa]SJZ37585.1 serine protease Do [Anaerorhabdus furcosa]
MKKFLVALIAVLLVWNSYLTYEISRVKTQETTGQKVTPIYNNNTINGFTTDLTNIVTKTESKVVGITSSAHEDLLGTGSGVVYGKDDSGVYIVTNQHVIQGATEIYVSFDNGETLIAHLQGSDAISDIALLVVQPTFSVEAFNLGNSSVVKKGEYVLAIGSPLDLSLQGSVSFGIISGIDRSIAIDTDDNGIEDWEMTVLQTDAAINPGNSGGPLINMSGDLIGITSMKLSGDDVEGLGFAIPINEIIPIVDQLKENGYVIRPILGVVGKDISQLTIYQKSYMGINLDRTKGVLITKVFENTPASTGGIQTNDILTKIGDTEITSFKDFRKALYSMNVGDEVVLTIVRDNNEVNITVVLE